MIAPRNFQIHGENEILEGIIIVRTYSPIGYQKENGRESNAWLPEIYAIQASENEPVTISKGGIVTESLRGLEFAFIPFWNDVPEELRDKVLHNFREGFVPDKCDETRRGDIAACGISLIEGSISREGALPYTSADKRDFMFRSGRRTLRHALTICCSSFPRNSYDLAFMLKNGKNPITVAEKYYALELKQEDVATFVEEAIKRLESVLGE